MRTPRHLLVERRQYLLDELARRLRDAGLGVPAKGDFPLALTRKDVQLRKAEVLVPVGLLEHFYAELSAAPPRKLPRGRPMTTGWNAMQNELLDSIEWTALPQGRELERHVRSAVTGSLDGRQRKSLKAIERRRRANKTT